MTSARRCDHLLRLSQSSVKWGYTKPTWSIALRSAACVPHPKTWVGLSRNESGRQLVDPHIRDIAFDPSGQFFFSFNQKDPSVEPPRFNPNWSIPLRHLNMPENLLLCLFQGRPTIWITLTVLISIECNSGWRNLNYCGVRRWECASWFGLKPSR